MDVIPLTWGYKYTREIARRMDKFRGELAGMHPAFPENSAAAIIPKADGPIPFNSPKIVYTAEDDKAIEELVVARDAEGD